MSSDDHHIFHQNNYTQVNNPNEKRTIQHGKSKTKYMFTIVFCVFGYLIGDEMYQQKTKKMTLFYTHTHTHQINGIWIPTFV
jgi:hypothetical protein